MDGDGVAALMGAAESDCDLVGVYVRVYDFDLVMDVDFVTDWDGRVTDGVGVDVRVGFLEGVNDFEAVGDGALAGGGDAVLVAWPFAVDGVADCVADDDGVSVGVAVGVARSARAPTGAGSVGTLSITPPPTPPSMCRHLCTGSTQERASETRGKTRRAEERRRQPRARSSNEHPHSGHSSASQCPRVASAKKHAPSNRNARHLPTRRAHAPLHACVLRFLASVTNNAAVSERLQAPGDSAAASGCKPGCDHAQRRARWGGPLLHQSNARDPLRALRPVRALQGRRAVDDTRYSDHVSKRLDDSRRRCRCRGEAC